MSTLPTANITLSTEVSSELNALFMSLDMPAEMKAEPALTKRIYAEAIERFPDRYALKAIRQYRNGVLGDGKWCPRAGELSLSIEKFLAADTADNRRRREIEADIADKKRREENPRPRPELHTVARLRADLAALAPDTRRDEWRAPTAAEAAEWLTAHKGGAGLAPVEISDTLRAQMLGEAPIAEGRLGTRPV